MTVFLLFLMVQERAFLLYLPQKDYKYLTFDFVPLEGIFLSPKLIFLCLIMNLNGNLLSVSLKFYMIKPRKNTRTRNNYLTHLSILSPPDKAPVSPLQLILSHFCTFYV